MNRLSTFDRGYLNATKTAITGTAASEEDWGLDMIGNWADYTQKTSGTTDLDQDRTHNDVNEISGVSETVGTAWIDPAHDLAGNMTTIPKPSSLVTGLTCKYDAWNRLVEVKDSSTVIGKYEYDGRNRRVKRHLDTAAPASPNGLDTYIHYFHNNSWQTLETRQSTTASAQPETLQPKHQYLSSPRYIDSPILRDENTDQDSLCNDQRLYYLNDANFNLTSLIDIAGDAVERYLYGPYGKVTIYDDIWSSTRGTPSYDNVILYTGRELDPEAGMMHYRNRYYSTELGRFVSWDPIGYGGSSRNLYEYALGNPVARTDPSGLLVPGTKDPRANTVVCDGKGGTKIQIGDPNKGKEPGESCGIFECIEVHEQKHKDDFDKDCPHLCKGGSAGARIAYDGGKGEAAKYEKAGYAAEKACLKGKLADWHAPKCTKVLKDRIKQNDDFVRDNFTPPSGKILDIMWLPPARPKCPC